MLERGFPSPLFLCLIIVDNKCNSCYNVALIFPGPEWPLSQGVAVCVMRCSNFTLLLMQAETIDRIESLAKRMLERCEDADQLANGMIFARGVLQDELAEKLVRLTEEPFHLIDVMARVPSLRETAWQKFLSLGPSDMAVSHVLTISAMSPVAGAELARRNPLPPPPSMAA